MAQVSPSHSSIIPGAMTSSSTSSSQQPIQLSFPLPHAIQSFVHIYLTILDTSALLFLTTSSAQPQSLDSATTTTTTIKPNALSALGSLVYAMPDVCFYVSFYLVLFSILTPPLHHHVPIAYSSSCNHYLKIRKYKK